MIIVIMIIFQHIFFIFLLEQKAISTWTFAFSFVFEKYAIYIRKILLVFYYLDSVLISKFYYQFSFRIYFISSIWAIIHYEYGNFEFPVTFHKYFFLCILLRCVRHHHSCNRVHYIRSQDYTHYKILFLLPLLFVLPDHKMRKPHLLFHCRKSSFIRVLKGIFDHKNKNC